MITSGAAGIADPQTGGVVYGNKTFLNYTIEGGTGRLGLNNTAGNSGVAEVATWGDGLDFAPVVGMTYVPRTDFSFQIALEAIASNGSLTRIRADDDWGFGVTNVGDARRIEWVSTEASSESIAFNVDLSNLSSTVKLLITGFEFGRGRELANARVSGFTGNASGTAQDSGVFGTGGSNGTLAWELTTPIEIRGGGVGRFSLSQATIEGAADDEDNGFTLQAMEFDIVTVPGVPGGADSTILYRDGSGRLVYHADEDGNRIVDFSHAGYHSGERDIPFVPVKETITPVAGDNTAHIQAAIDAVAARSPDANGHRGAVLLRAGNYEMLGPVYIRKDGIVLRGEGQGENGTVLIDAAGKNIQNKGLVIFESSIGGTVEEAGTRQDVTSEYIPAGCRTFSVENASIFKIGDLLVIEHLATADWLDAINYGNTNGDDVPWVPFQTDLRMTFQGNVTAIEGNQIKLDTPIYHVLDRSLSQAQVFRHNGRQQIRECGVENLRGFSRTTGPTDESHLWDFVHFFGAENCWAIDSTAVAFADSGFRFTRSRRSTVLNCSVLDPDSLPEGGRRYNFYVSGDCHDLLFKGCVARNGRHCFVANGAANVNGIVFTQSESIRAYSTSENHRRWGSAMLWDNITWTNPNAGTVLGFYNRGDVGTSHGWTGTGLVGWNIQAPGRIVLCEEPPVGQNYAIGCTAIVVERWSYPGWIEANNEELSIPSLYEAQLAERLTYGVGPDAPVKLEVAYYDNSNSPFVALKWLDTAMDEEEFIIERSNNGGTSYTEVTRVPANRQSFVDRTVSKNGSYKYRLRASNSIGKSAYSNVSDVRLSDLERAEVIRYQAEYFKNSLNSTLDWGTYRYTGKGNMRLNAAGSWVEWEVDGGSGGQTDVVFRYRSIGARSAVLYVNGNPGVNVTFPEPPKYSPLEYSNSTWDYANLVRTVNLSAGTNTIRMVLQSSSGYLYLDRIDVSLMQRAEGLDIGYASWAASLGLTGGPQEDDDGDGATNFEEYATNGGPTNPNDRGYFPEVTFLEDKAQLTYARRTDDLSLTYDLQTSSDLRNWQHGGIIIERNDDGDYEIVTEEFDIGSNPWFARVLLGQD